MEDNNKNEVGKNVEGDEMKHLYDKNKKSNQSEEKVEEF